MSIFAKVRNLGQYGIISDIDPYDLPPEAFSAGVNVRFRNGHVSRGPVFRDAFAIATDTSGPRFTFSYTPVSGEDLLFVGYLDGRVFLTTPSAETDYSITGYSTSSVEDAWTNTALANVLYINRSDRAPWYYDGSVNHFQTLPYWGMVVATNYTGNITSGSNQLTTVASIPSGLSPSNGQTLIGAGIPTGTTISSISGTTITMSANATATTTGVPFVAGTQQTWSAAVLRSCGGTLVAMNVTINGTNNSNMIITSTQAEAGLVPASWDYSNIATDATQNTLAELEGGIIDSCTLGSNLTIYGFNQAWLMVPASGTEIFDYFKLPFAKGALNANCSVEIDGKNYVFGPDDIWAHDGTAEQSIATKRARDYIFSSLNFAETARCFVQHNPALKEIYFCYVSGDNLVHFTQANVGGCNRCATYNYADDNWTFDDLPSVYSATYANLSITQTWATITSTWSTVGGSWQSQDQNLQRTTCFVGDTNSAYSLTQHLYAFDLYGSGSTTSFPVDLNATAGSYLERDGLDLDMIQGVDLPDYKLFSSVFPLARIDANANTQLSVAFGTSDYYGQAAVFDGSPQTYDGDTLYKLDFNQSGRYAAMTITYNDYTTFSISGFDFLVDETGQR